jgi:predicted phosphodiesterase
MKSIMNRELQQMKDVASGIVKGILASTPKADVAFKRMIPLQEGEVREVLVLGHVHPEYNDGYCIAVLNPGAALQEQLQPAVAYSPAILKELVAGHCEAMVQVSLVGGKTREIGSYRARAV